MHLFDVNGSAIGYGKVSVSLHDNSKTVNIFTDYISNPDDEPINFRLFFNTGQGVYSGSTPISSDDRPYPPNTTFFWERGLPWIIETRDGSGSLLRKVENFYDFTVAPKRDLTAIKYMGGWFYADGYPLTLYEGSYHLISQPLLLDKSITTEYDQSDPGNDAKTVQKVTEYAYNDPNNLLPTTVITYDPKFVTAANPNDPLVKYINENKYVTHADYDHHGSSDPDTKAIHGLRGKNALTTLVESTSWYEEDGTKYLLSASYTIFKEQTDPLYILPHETWSLIDYTPFSSYTSSYVNSGGTFIAPSGNGAFRLMNTFESYDLAYGKLLQQTGFNGVQETYEWANEGSLLIATNAKVGTLIFRKETDHQPLVGIIQERDENSLATTYGYDAQNRLLFTKDKDGNIVNQQ